MTDAGPIEPVRPLQHFTQPPPRYTEASLVRTLEEENIGRPSTYATIVDTVVKRGYVSREKRSLAPTDLGVAVNRLLIDSFPDVFSVGFTAQMEEELDGIEEGEMPVPVEGTCPECGAGLVARNGPYGRFISCARRPDCKYTRPFTLGIKCPQCGEGEFAEKRTRRGKTFFGCTRYPDCDFAVWDRPRIVPCPNCGAPFLVEKQSKKGLSLRCIKCKSSFDPETIGA